MKNCVVTGGNSGIGYEACLLLAQKGCHVTMICRNEERALDATHRIIQQTGNPHVDYIKADISRLKDVVEAVRIYREKGEKLDVLINNAADFDLSVKSPIYTEDHLERQFATNVVAPYLLSKLFLEDLRTSGDGRIINISSQGLCVYPFLKLHLDRIDGHRRYKPSTSYYQNKLALLMFSLAMRESMSDVKIQAVRVTNVKIDITRYSSLSPVMKRMYAWKSKFSIPPQEMAKVYVHLSLDDDLDGFLYDENCREVKANRYAYDKAGQQELVTKLDQICQRSMNEKSSFDEKMC